MNWCTQDYGLNALELESKYQKYDYHYQYRRRMWEVSGSKLPYWKWVEEQLCLEMEELDRNNPYTQGYSL